MPRFHIDEHKEKGRSSNFDGVHLNCSEHFLVSLVHCASSTLFDSGHIAIVARACQKCPQAKENKANKYLQLIDFS
jgi:hypothetical protein